MNKAVKNKTYLLLVSVFIAVCLALTPWLNVDSLVIPKVVILFCAALYFLPILLFDIKNFLSNRTFKILLILSCLIIIQMVFVMITSSAPWEQQVFGKSGRGLGFITEISIIIVMLVASRYVEFDKTKILINGVLLSAFISSAYAIVQRYGYDIFDWYTRTNGIIGTLGNPNFQSAFAAIAIIPSALYFVGTTLRNKILSILMVFTFAFTIYICQSTQGYLVSAFSLCVILLLYFWYRHKLIFVGISTTVLTFGLIVIAGMLNMGPLASTLYKVSIQSRGEFFRSAISGAKDNPLFGVGIDSFGDFSSYYKSAKDASGINEYTDNAHNYFLNYAVNGGFLLALLYLALTILTIICFFRFQRNIGKFDISAASVFSLWVGFQAQSMISPGTIPLLLLGFLLNGSIIGLSVWGLSDRYIFPTSQNNLFKPFSYFLFFIALLVIYPYFNVDRMQLKSLKTGDGLLAIASAKAYPESSLRYQRIGNTLLESNLLPQSLEVGRSAVEFNPNSISAWGLILANPSATIEERRRAVEEILRIDPFNKDVLELQKLIK
jgi:O-antigen ligase